MGSERSEHVFIVRLWHEAGAAADAWRGSVAHVASGKRLYFTDLEALTSYIDARLGGFEAPAASSHREA